jgi:hypothetical protein
MVCPSPSSPPTSASLPPPSQPRLTHHCPPPRSHPTSPIHLGRRHHSCNRPLIVASRDHSRPSWLRFRFRFRLGFRPRAIGLHILTTGAMPTNFPPNHPNEAARSRPDPGPLPCPCRQSTHIPPNITFPLTPPHAEHHAPSSNLTTGHPTTTAVPTTPAQPSTPLHRLWPLCFTPTPSPVPTYSVSS